jgi:glycine/D-amino acid oxidase-like deaminating enzyme
MRSDGGRSVSSWMATGDTPESPPLVRDEKADVVIVGAGIAGLTTAYHLLLDTRSVVVLDDGRVGGGETARTTGHLVTALDTRWLELEKLHGAKGARMAAESHALAISKIESIARTETIDCEFERLDGYLFAGPDDKTEVLERELDAARRAGLTEIDLVRRAPLLSFDTGRCLRFPGQAQFHAVRYLAGLVQAVRKMGGRVFGDAHVVEFQGGKDPHVRTQRGQVVRADAVVVATHSPVNDRVVVHTKQYPQRSYVIGARVPRRSVHRALYWDTADPFHYVRLQPLAGEDADLLLVGGEDHPVGREDDGAARYGALESWMRARFPFAGAVDHRWSGQIMESEDGLAFIGRNPGDENVFIATGDSGNGLTHGTIAGVLLTDLIVSRPNEWVDLYDPSRKTLRAAWRWAKENAKTAGRYADWAKRPDVRSEDEIRPDEGAIVHEGARRVACYRRPDGALVRLSAVCPHLGGMVEWNSAEKTWDCPCHGSRFAPDGHVVNGPSKKGLSKA